MDYLGTPPPLPGYEPIGRMLINCFDVPERAILHANYWDYYDWLVEQGYDMVDWVKRADSIRKDGMCFSEHLMFCLWHDECNRYRSGQLCPSSSPPVGYVDKT
jgi:hypothetical protein